MFGYIVVNEDELKIGSYKRYRSYYCGLCKTLKEKYGIRGQATLSFDMTFLVILLTALYEPENEEYEGRCALHPFGKHMIRKNEFSDYVADMNVILSYYKCRDDWDDNRKVLRLAYSGLLNSAMGRIGVKYPDKAMLIHDKLRQIRILEENKETKIDKASGLFG